ncbi:MAG TPA: glycoside hydrolase family 3 C-terminal domain-containing protein [Gemmatimonadales bacterium]|jgi:beta-glucosidase|nr:glycoside hydrolase family 3 C-terminal domain-containing protein [Gemmatimonadales bacterium]
MSGNDESRASRAILLASLLLSAALPAPAQVPAGPPRPAALAQVPAALSRPPAPAQAPPPAQAPAWRNPDLPFEQRVRDLVGRMTLEEKVSQMQDVAPAIERLGIPEYNWWNEALHGVARSGLATSFPQAIGLAATWDDSLMFRMATVISDEARAKYHEYLRNGRHQRYQGLTFWSPNINLFRDPRWGRGQETYGEDPFLTGRLAVQFIGGLQGDDPKYFKTVATVKHFAVHSGPEPERHTFDAVVSERDLRESYLPHFEAGIREGHAYSLMCAYNRVLGKPACGSDLLIRDILRGEWGFPGYIVSDCGAIDDMYLRHKVVATAAQAAALGVRTGTDLDCGRVYPNLVDAVTQGLLTGAAIDTSVSRLFLARMKLGMFDPPEQVRWAQIPYSVLDQPAHRALARRAAQESIVLLKNHRGVLPLRKDLGTIAVIGPNADDQEMLLGNYNGEPADPVTPLRGIREAVGKGTTVLYARGADLAGGFSPSDSVPLRGKGDSGLLVQAMDAARRADAVVLFLGLSPRLEGEEMPVELAGFRGGDRTSLDLPEVQERLLERIVAVGKPTVLVLMSGSALSVNWAEAHVPAILEAWYPGQAAGSAIADVLFGDYNPAGRLPVTFYRSVNDLPPFDDYRMAGRTYRFFGGTPLYPFGHGLSYTTFAYKNLKTSDATLRAGDTLTVYVDVTNTGARAGAEVVQLYVQHLGSKVERPKEDLRGFRRVTLAPGHTRTIAFSLAASSLAYWNPDTHGWVVEEELVRLRVGASSADIRAERTIRVAARR